MCCLLPLLPPSLPLPDPPFRYSLSPPFSPLNHTHPTICSRPPVPLSAPPYTTPPHTTAGQRIRGYAGSPFYIAPEVLNGRYGFEVDVWSLGVILYTLLSQRLPFWHSTDIGVYRAILKGHVDTHTGAWLHVSKDAVHLVRRMLCQDPAERITLDQLLEHPWILKHDRDTSPLPQPLPDLPNWKLSKRRRAIARSTAIVVPSFRLPFCITPPDGAVSSETEPDTETESEPERVAGGYILGYTSTDAAASGGAAGAGGGSSKGGVASSKSITGTAVASGMAIGRRGGGSGPLLPTTSSSSSSLSSRNVPLTSLITPLSPSQASPSSAVLIPPSLSALSTSSNRRTLPRYRTATDKY
ncbi:unnamed protein product [Closterium sp. NIES-54]